MLSADLSLQMNNSSFFISITLYSPSGNTKLFVYPYMVSGLNVAQTKKRFFPASVASTNSGLMTLYLMSVYS